MKFRALLFVGIFHFSSIHSVNAYVEHASVYMFGERRIILLGDIHASPGVTPAAEVLARERFTAIKTLIDTVVRDSPSVNVLIETRPSEYNAFMNAVMTNTLAQQRFGVGIQGRSQDAIHCFASRLPQIQSIPYALRIPHSQPPVAGLLVHQLTQTSQVIMREDYYSVFHNIFYRGYIRPWNNVYLGPRANLAQGLSNLLPTLQADREVRDLHWQDMIDRMIELPITWDMLSQYIDQLRLDAARQDPMGGMTLGTFLSDLAGDTDSQIRSRFDSFKRRYIDMAALPFDHKLATDLRYQVVNNDKDVILYFGSAHITALENSMLRVLPGARKLGGTLLLQPGHELTAADLLTLWTRGPRRAVP